MMFIEIKESRYGVKYYLNPSLISYIKYNIPNEWVVSYGGSEIFINDETLKKILAYGNIKIV